MWSFWLQFLYWLGALGPAVPSQSNRAAPPTNYLQERSKEDPTEQVSVLFLQTCNVKTEPESHPGNNPEIQTLQVETDDRQQFLMLGEPTVTKWTFSYSAICPQLVRHWDMLTFFLTLEAVKLKTWRGYPEFTGIGSLFRNINAQTCCRFACSALWLLGCVRNHSLLTI